MAVSEAPGLRGRPSRPPAPRSGWTPASPPSTASSGCWCTGLNRLLFRTTVAGADRVPAEGPVIIAPVHRSFIDFFVASEVTRRKLHYMAKDSLWENRLLAAILPALGAFPVHRESADREALRRAQQVLEAGEVLDPVPGGGASVGAGGRPTSTRGSPSWPPAPGPRWCRWASGVRHRSCPRGRRSPDPSHIHLEVGEPLAAPARTGGGRISRSRTHQLTEPLTASVQDLYDRRSG